MAQVHIRTKVHKLLPMVEANLAYVMTDKADAKHYTTYTNGDTSTLTSFINDVITTVPIFAVDHELIATAVESDFQKSMLDMKRADVLRLPFPVMVVEFEVPKKNLHVIALLRDMKHREILPFEDADILQCDAAFDFYGTCITLQKDDRGEYFTVAPATVYLRLEEEHEVTNKKSVWITVASTESSLLPHTDEVKALIKTAQYKTMGYVCHAMAAALLLMATEGVKKEIIEPTKINKKRKLSNKPPIPRHTYISIGHVYRSGDSNKSDTYDARRSPRPHWRRGHNRGIRYGKGRVNIKQTYINPRLVAFAGDAEPKPSIYVVTP